MCAKAQTHGAFRENYNTADEWGRECNWEEIMLESQTEARSRKALSIILKTVSSTCEQQEAIRGWSCILETIHWLLGEKNGLDVVRLETGTVVRR